MNEVTARALSNLVSAARAAQLSAAQHEQLVKDAQLLVIELNKIAGAMA